MRKTKIICTIGPSCENRETLIKMVEAGMNVARLNFSHGTHEEHAKRIELIKSIREEMGIPIAIMLDTKGPEYRIRTFKDGKIELKEGDKFTFTTEEIIGDEHIVAVSYKNLAKELVPGDKILLNDGLLSLTVDSTDGVKLDCTVNVGGPLSDRKSMSFPGKVLKQEYLSEQDKSDILFGISQDIDFVAASFVSNKEDVMKIRNLLNENGGSEIEIIAKIENRSGVDNIEEIINASEGIMVARGDLGVEIPFEEIPHIQKMLISRCRREGKRSVTATEMLESMTNKIRPTRAEISDVANAVYDGTSAIMLSGETAAGKYPIESVRTMSNIAYETEQNINYMKRFYNAEFKIKNSNDAFSHAVCALAMDIEAKLIAVCTHSGTTARMVSRFRGPVPIIAITTSKKAYEQLAMSWAVTPVMTDVVYSVDALVENAVSRLKKRELVSDGDRIVVTAGDTNGKSGNTNLIKMEVIK